MIPLVPWWRKNEMSLNMAAQNTQIQGWIPCAAATGSNMTTAVSIPAVTGSTRRTASVTPSVIRMKSPIRPSTKSKP